MQPIVLFRPALLVLTLTVAGCSLAPNYQRPEAPVAASWTPTVEATGSFAADVLDWKTFIIDPQLHRVVDAALSNNRSLRQALLDIEAARAQYRVQRADRLPSINANATGSRQRLPADLSSSGRSDVSSSYQVGPGLTEYEVDLFGGGATGVQYLNTQLPIHICNLSHRSCSCVRCNHTAPASLLARWTWRSLMRAGLSRIA